MHEPQSSGVCIITHFDRNEVVMAGTVVVTEQQHVD